MESRTSAGVDADLVHAIEDVAQIGLVVDPHALNGRHDAADHALLRSCALMASLLEQNRWLRNPSTRARAMRIAAASSSAVEGIRKPYAERNPVKPAPRKRRTSG
jgi:hypothetical protein